MPAVIVDRAMTPEVVTFLTLGVFAIALLYAAVGHAGASGYIAVMSLFSLAPEAIRPTALILNIVVACVAGYQFQRAGYFSWRLFWPFAIVATPMAFCGGYVSLPMPIFNVLVGLVLLGAAVHLWRRPAVSETAVRAPATPMALGSGGALGLLAGLTGTGGGVFLTPLLIVKRWAPTKSASAVSAMFILCNSIAGLAGNVTATQTVPAFALPLVGAVLIGGTVGAYLGSRRLPHTAIKRLLAIVLTIAGTKLVMAG
jgi:uncharacterized protein